MTYRRTRAIARKEFLHILRDPRSLASALGQPLIMLILFGWALSLDLDHLPTVIYDLDQTPQSRDLVRDFRGSRYFDIVDEVHSYRPIEQAIDARRALMGIVIPNDYAKNLGLGKEAQVQVLLDGSDSNTASIALGYSTAVISAHSRNIQISMQSLRAGSVVKGGVESQVRVWYNPDLLSQNFIVPGLIAVILMVIAANLSSLCIAREWENGTMEQLLSTPVRPAELALGKLSAYFVVGMVDMLICLFVGLWGFGVPFKGSLVLLLVSSCIFLFGALAWGIFISASNRTQLTAYQMGALTSFLPAF